MKKSILYLFISVSVYSFSQPDYSNGVYDNLYYSYYPNGNLKASGRIDHNQRIGDWSFYAEDGTLAAKITYSCNTYFKTTETHNHLNTSLSIPLYDSDKLFLLPLEDHHVEWTKRLYRDIPASGFGLATEFNFFDFLKTIQTDKVLCFADDQFQNPISSVDDVANRDQVICGYRIKMDYFFRNDYHFMDARIVGIAPLYQTNNGETKEICWLYYHGLKDIVFGKINNSEGYSMKTILQKRQYPSTIFKEMTVSGKTIEELSTNERERERLNFEIDKSIIEVENDLIIKSYF